MDREIDPIIQRRRQLIKLGRIAVAVLISVVTILFLSDFIKPSVSRRDVRTAFVEMGDVSTTIVASGVARPKFEEIVTSPITTRVQAIYANLGATVNKGDSLMKLDSLQIEREISRLEDQIQLKTVEKNAVLQNSRADMRELESRKELLSIDLKNQRLRLQRYQDLYEKEVVSKFDWEDRAIEVEKTEVEQRQINQRIADLNLTAKNQIERLELENKILNHQLAEQQRLLAECDVKATSSGVITGLMDQPGQSVNQGAEIVRIADLSNYHIEASVSDFYRGQLSEGSPVTFTLDEQVVRGKLSKILPTVAAEGVLSLNIDFDAVNPNQLQPNMRFDVEIVTRQEANGLRLRNGPAFDSSANQEVFVVQDNSLYKRAVQFGMANTKYIQILDGLSPGDEVVISDMDSYLHLDKVGLN